MSTSPSNIVLLIHKSVPEIPLLLTTLNTNVHVIEYDYKTKLSIEDFAKLFKENEDVRLGLMYDNLDNTMLPFYLDRNDKTSSGNFVSDHMKNIIDQVKTLTKTLNIDLITCNLNTPLITNELDSLTKDNVICNYSINSTGTLENDDFIMENTGVSIKQFYFTEQIVNWKHSLGHRRCYDRMFSDLESFGHYCSSTTTFKFTENMDYGDWPTQCGYSVQYYFSNGDIPVLTIDGNNNVINMEFNDNAQCIGMFQNSGCYSTKLVIKNLTINARLVKNYFISDTGIISGNCSQQITFINCKLNILDHKNHKGIIGNPNSQYSYGNNVAGGFIGSRTMNISFNKCEVHANVTSGSGGFLGRFANHYDKSTIKIDNCLFDGNVNDNSGGFIAVQSNYNNDNSDTFGSKNIIINNSTFNGNVSNYSGGFIASYCNYGYCDDHMSHKVEINCCRNMNHTFLNNYSAMFVGPYSMNTNCSNKNYITIKNSFVNATCNYNSIGFIASFDGLEGHNYFNINHSYFDGYIQTSCGMFGYPFIYDGIENCHTHVNLCHCYTDYSNSYDGIEDLSYLKNHNCELLNNTSHWYVNEKPDEEESSCESEEVGDFDSDYPLLDTQNVTISDKTYDDILTIKMDNNIYYRFNDSFTSNIEFLVYDYDDIIYSSLHPSIKKNMKSFKPKIAVADGIIKYLVTEPTFVSLVNNLGNTKYIEINIPKLNNDTILTICDMGYFDDDNNILDISHCNENDGRPYYKEFVDSYIIYTPKTYNFMFYISYS